MQNLDDIDYNLGDHTNTRMFRNIPVIINTIIELLRID